MSIIDIICEELVELYRLKGLDMLRLADEIDCDLYNSEIKELRKNLRDTLQENNTLQIKINTLDDIDDKNEREVEMRSIFVTKCIVKVTYEAILTTLYLLSGHITEAEYNKRFENIVNDEFKKQMIDIEKVLE